MIRFLLSLLICCAVAVSTVHGQPATLDLDGLETIDHQVAFDFYRSRFSSVGDFNFMFVGNINHKDLQKYIEQYIAPLPKGKAPAKPIDRGVRFNQTAVRQHVYRGQDDKCTVQLMFPATTIRNYNESQKITALSMTMTFLLLEMVREEASGVYMIQSFPQIAMAPHPEVVISVYFQCDPSRVDELIEIVEQQIQTIKDNTFDEKFLTNFQEGYKNQIEQVIRQNFLWVSILHNYFISEGIMKQNDLLNFANGLDHFTAADISEAARKYIDFEKMMTVILFQDPDLVEDTEDEE